MLVQIKRNPLTDAHRKALDSATLALAIHGIYVNEFHHGNGTLGVEYIAGKGTDGHVVAQWDADKTGNGDLSALKNDLTRPQYGLIEAHSALYASLK